MGERAPKPAEGYRMRNTSDNSIVEMDAATAHRAMNTFGPRASLPMYVPLGDLPGFTFKDDGGTVATTFDPETALQAAQNFGNKKYPHRLALGKDDPGWEAAQIYREDQVLKRIGENKGFFEVFGERMADVATFGAYGAIADDNEEEAQIRAYQNLYNPFASTLGTFGGIATGLVAPYGTLARVLGKGAMAAGRASGLVESARLANLASKTGKVFTSASGKPINNLIGVSAKATETAAAALKARGASEFVQNYGGGLVSLAVAEAPLSLAVASADIVDYNKEFSAQALVADAGSLWLMGMAIGGGIGFTGAVLRKGAGGIRRSVAGETAKGGKGAAASDLAIDVFDHAVRRQTYRGTGSVEGATKATIAHKFFQWLRKGARSNVAKKFTGEAVENAQTVAKTFREAGNGLHAGMMGKAPDLVDAARAAQKAAATPEVAAMLDDIIVGAPQAVTSAQSLDIAIRQFKEIYAPEWARALGKRAKGAPSIGAKGLKEAKARLQTLRTELETQARNGNSFASRQAELAKQLGGIEKSITTKTAYDRLYQAHKAVMESGSLGTVKALTAIDDIFYAVTKNHAGTMQQLADFKAWSLAKGKLQGVFDEIGSSRGWVYDKNTMDTIAGSLETMRQTGKSVGMSPLALKKLVKDADTMANDAIKSGLQTVDKINRARRAILFDEFDGFRSVLKPPTGPHGELNFGDEMLDTQIEAVMQQKKATGSALRSLVLKGSPRGAVSFAGVLAYRNMTQEQKRQNFESVREIVLETAASPERMIEAIGKTAGKLAATDMQMATAYSITLATAQGYLLQQMPRSSDPLIGPRDFSMQEIDSYLETIGALESPASVIASAKDGSVSIEAVDAIRTVYPELYTDMVLDLVEFMQTRDWEKLNEAQRLGLDTFTGGALGILRSYGAAPAPLYAQTPMQQQALGKNMQQSSPQMARQQSQMNSTGSQKVSGL